MTGLSRNTQSWNDGMNIKDIAEYSLVLFKEGPTHKMKSVPATIIESRANN